VFGVLRIISHNFCLLLTTSAGENVYIHLHVSLTEMIRHKNVYDGTGGVLRENFQLNLRHLCASLPFFYDVSFCVSEREVKILSGKL
jgi:hypothetical protein